MQSNRKIGIDLPMKVLLLQLVGSTGAVCYQRPMSSSSYRRHRFPAAVIQQAVWLYFRFPLSLRDVEDMLAQRGIDVSYGHCHIKRNWPNMDDRPAG